MPMCCMCHEDKPAAEFAFRSLATGELQSHCRACHAAYRRQHYLDNRDVYIAREVARMNSYRAENRVLLFEYLSVHPCVDCGEDDPVVLEFDHVDRTTKRSEVARIASAKPWKVVLAEIEKCEVRCGNCHRRKTAKDLGWSVPVLPKRSGVPTVAASISSQAPAPPSDPADVRECTGCHQVKPLIEFSVKNKHTGRRVTRCHACVALASRRHYARNQPAYVAKARRNRRASRRRNGARKVEFLAGASCVDCGETDPVVLEFDHRDGVDKRASVSNLLEHGWSTIQAEIEKCAVRCVNCHRRRTAVHFGWSKLSLQRSTDTMSSTRE